jgi:hypothetical protein
VSSECDTPIAALKKSEINKSQIRNLALVIFAKNAQ